MTEEEENLKKRERASVAEANRIHNEIKKEVITDFLNWCQVDDRIDTDLQVCGQIYVSDIVQEFKSALDKYLK